MDRIRLVSNLPLPKCRPGGDYYPEDTVSINSTHPFIRVANEAASKARKSRLARSSHARERAPLSPYKNCHRCQVCESAKARKSNFCVLHCLFAR
jgi:hypothetical protein